MRIVVVQQNSKFTLLSNMQTTTIQILKVQQNSKFTLLSNIGENKGCESQFSRIQNLHFSQTITRIGDYFRWFSRIQNLHFSQTNRRTFKCRRGLVEFKIYTSLKLIADLENVPDVQQNSKFTLLSNTESNYLGFYIVQQNSKFTLLSNCYICFLNFYWVQQNSKFTLLSNNNGSGNCAASVQQNSKFTLLSNSSKKVF